MTSTTAGQSGAAGQQQLSATTFLNLVGSLIDAQECLGKMAYAQGGGELAACLAAGIPLGECMGGKDQKVDRQSWVLGAAVAKHAAGMGVTVGEGEARQGEAPAEVAIRLLRQGPLNTVLRAKFKEMLTRDGVFERDCLALGVGEGYRKLVALNEQLGIFASDALRLSQNARATTNFAHTPQAPKPKQACPSSKTRPPSRPIAAASLRSSRPWRTIAPRRM